VGGCGSRWSAVEEEEEEEEEGLYLHLETRERVQTNWRCVVSLKRHSRIVRRPGRACKSWSAAGVCLKGLGFGVRGSGFGVQGPW